MDRRVTGRAARPATRRLVELLEPPDGAHLLDVGCGIGGTARLLVSTGVGRVSGIDLNPDYVAVGTALNQRVGLADRIELAVGSALELGLDPSSVDGAVMLHVGMNIADKHRLMTEVARVLRPGASFGVYDLMRVGSGSIGFPVPWSSEPATSWVSSPEDYRLAAEAAGFEVVAQNDRTAEAEAAFERLQAGAGSPLGLHVIMGPSAPSKIANMVAAIRNRILAPTELLLRRP